MESKKWYSRARDYDREKKEKEKPREETVSHPLKSYTVTMCESKVQRSSRGSSGTSTPKDKKASHVLDPLNAMFAGSDPLSFLAAEAQDPLSQMVQQMELSGTRAGRSGSQSSAQSNDSLDDTFEPWSVKCPSILARYTTSEKLSITTSFLSGAEKTAIKLSLGKSEQSNVSNVVVARPSQATTVTDKVKNRLEQLDDFEEGSVQEMLNLSQQEYCNRIEELNNALIEAWEQDQRVKALKIVIQCAKLLANVAVIQFYPSKFVLVTNILDTFGRLVYERIRNKAQYVPKGSSIPIQLPENFTPDQVPESAKETCRNWFFKIASIRELVPRLYVEAAILKCYSFLTTSEYQLALQRLALMTRGIGDPLVAVYSRCYLCRVGILVAPKIRDHMMPCFEDFLSSYSQVQGDSVQNILAVQKLELPEYLTLYSPALDWILQCLANRAEEHVLVNVLGRSKKACNSALLLNSIMSAFKPEYISARAMEFTEMIKECEETGFPKYLLYRSLGLCLVMSDPPEDQNLLLLNDVWKVVMKLKLPAEYITCAEVWIEFVVKHFSKREVNTILGDIIKHLTPDRTFEAHYGEMQSVMTKILTHIHDFSILFSMDKFLPFLDMFQKDSVKVDVCKNIMEAYAKNQVESTNDPVIMNALMYVCKTMHDHVNALTLEDEIRTIGGLINGFLRSISFGQDFEQQLSFYVEARASFCNIDYVLMFLVQSVNRLAIETRRMVKGSHSRKTAAFVRACAAYSFITIPSLNGIFSRLQLYLVSGQVALLNQCITQGDAFFKAAISLVSEVPRMLEIDGKQKSTEPMLLEFINNFLATLLYVPDNPDQGVLYLCKGLLNMLDTYTWERNSDYKIHAYINTLAMLSAVTQETLIDHVDKVDSNDTMYGQDPKFLGEVDQVTTMLITQILNHLSELDTPQTGRRQALLSVELMNRLLAHADLDQPSMASLVLKLWNLSNKHGQADKKTMARIASSVKERSQQSKGFADIAVKIKV